jgi:hypothetical protein
MKKILLFITLAVASLYFASCKKCTTCTTTYKKGALDSTGNVQNYCHKNGRMVEQFEDVYIKSYSIYHEAECERDN